MELFALFGSLFLGHGQADQDTTSGWTSFGRPRISHLHVIPGTGRRC